MQLANWQKQYNLTFMNCQFPHINTVKYSAIIQLSKDSKLQFGMLLIY